MSETGPNYLIIYYKGNRCLTTVQSDVQYVYIAACFSQDVIFLSSRQKSLTKVENVF